MLGGTTIINMDTQAVLKVILDDLPKDQRALIDQATEEFHQKCLLSYSKKRESVI